MLNLDESLRNLTSIHGTGSNHPNNVPDDGHESPKGVKYDLNRNSIMSYSIIVILLCLVIPVFTIGCQERVISRTGIGADETNPHVSEPDGGDRLSNYIWNNSKKK